MSIARQWRGEVTRRACGGDANVLRWQRLSRGRNMPDSRPTRVLTLHYLCSVVPTLLGRLPMSHAINCSMNCTHA